MSRERQIRSYDYVNHPYERVRDALTEDARAVFQAATKAAASRAKLVASELKVNVAGIEIGTDVSIEVTHIASHAADAVSPPSTCLSLEWAAVNAPHLFPLMKAELSIYPVTTTETQLDFHGSYQPPGGLLGSAFDSVVGHRIADASVHRFIAEVAEHLRVSLDQSA